MSYHVIDDPQLVREALARDTDFLPTNSLEAVTPLSPEALRILSRSGFDLPPILASASGAAHREMRRRVAPYFSPAALRTLTPRITELVREQIPAIEQALITQPANLDALISRVVPALVMQELFGVQAPGLDVLNRWSIHSLELFWGSPAPARQLHLAQSAAEFFRWLRRLTAPHRIADAPGLIGDLHRAGLDRREICALAYFLVIAGHETTAQLLSTVFFAALEAERPWREFQDAATAEGFVYDVLATRSPVTQTRRVTGCPVSLGAESIPAGTELLLTLTGHEDAPTTRRTALAFGHGVHRCLGASLAVREATIALSEIARAFPDLVRASGEVQWSGLLSFRAPQQVFAERRS